MTDAELRELLASYELRTPITPDDVLAIYDDVRPRLACGVRLTVRLALEYGGERVMVRVGEGERHFTAWAFAS